MGTQAGHSPDFYTDSGGNYWQAEEPHLLVMRCSPKHIDEGRGRHAWSLHLETETDDHEPSAIAWDQDRGWDWLKAQREAEERDFSDVDVCPCLIIGEHVVICNDFGVKTHDDLERAFADAREALEALGYSEQQAA